MTPTDTTKRYVISRYVEPARLRGEKTIQVRVGNVLKELGWANRTPSVFSTLGSQSFQKEAGVELIEKRGGPVSGGPSTTVQFVYRILDDGVPSAPVEKVRPNGAGLMALYGICKETFRKLGGGEAYLKAERNWGPDAWEKYEAELARMKKEGSQK
ncbi:MAG: hypothetical protein WBE76_20600 [Terracidiphilus sp.]